MSTDSSITSKFKFLGYKLDNLSVSMYPSLDLLEAMAWDNDFNFGVNIRIPEFHSSSKKYLSGVSCKLIKRANTDSGEDIEALSITASIVGLFQVDERFSDVETEMKIVSHQFPTILFPYLRGAVSTILSCSGFGGIVLPLVNILEASKKALKDVKVQVIE